MHTLRSESTSAPWGRSPILWRSSYCHSTAQTNLDSDMHVPSGTDGTVARKRVHTWYHGPLRNCVSPRISLPQHRISLSNVKPQTCLKYRGETRTQRERSSACRMVVFACSKKIDRSDELRSDVVGKGTDYNRKMPIAAQYCTEVGAVGGVGSLGLRARAPNGQESDMEYSRICCCSKIISPSTSSN